MTTASPAIPARCPKMLVPAGRYEVTLSAKGLVITGPPASPPGPPWEWFAMGVAVGLAAAMLLRVCL